MKKQINGQFSQRQLRVGELVKQSLGQIFLRDLNIIKRIIKCSNIQFGDVKFHMGFI